VIWSAGPDNEPSRITATRLGFKRDEALDDTSSSDPILAWTSSVTSEDWANGVRDHIDHLMSREYKSRGEEN
jgi:RimJ/RimL family protein N-acetyltransferase